MLTLILLSVFTFHNDQTPAAAAPLTASPPETIALLRDGDDGKADILIEFEGNNIFTADDLRARMEYTKDAGLVARSGKQDILESLDLDLKRMDNYMRSKGYLQARHGEPRVEFLRKRTTDTSSPQPSLSAAGPALRVTVSIEEGRIYKIGVIKIEGNSVISEQQIMSAIGLNPGDIADGERIGEALYENLKETYGAKGFIQYSAEPTPTFRDNPQDPNEGTVDFDITIDEGQQFRVRSIMFAGNKLTSEEDLRRVLLLREGDVYNQSLFEKSIQKMNQLGLFDEVDKEKDVDFKVDKVDQDDEWNAQSDVTPRVKELDITIRIKEKTEQ